MTLPDDAVYQHADEEEPTQLVEHVAKQMQDDEVLIVQYIGSEKMRYLSGQSVALNNKGVIINQIDLNDIMEGLEHHVTAPQY